MRLRSSSSQGRIDFEDVTFRYANTVTDAISNLNFAYRARQNLCPGRRQRRR